jgi:hypothetical protein
MPKLEVIEEVDEIEENDDEFCGCLMTFRYIYGDFAGYI